ncbi:hypothetical protein ACFE04_023232 [Oxalis oulophora]
MEEEKEEFLNKFGSDYGYPNAPISIDQLRSTHFNRLQANAGAGGGGGVVYLDHAGATLYSDLQMEAVFKDLTSNLYGNPHSQSDSSLSTADIVREAREQVLSYCNASPKDYKCIFTSGATAALKLVGETFPWSRQSTFMYTMENHNSVLGIREYALSRGASAIAVDIEGGVYDDKLSATCIKVSGRDIQKRNEVSFSEVESKGTTYNLFAFPSECNFSGLRFNLDLVKAMKDDPVRILEGTSHSKGDWKVLIDAAKGSATNPPDLSLYPADFVAISFYKGYSSRSDYCKNIPGTVASSIADMDFVKRREGIEELFEDGTISFLSVASIRHGFNILNSLTISAIHRQVDWLVHTASLTTYVKKTLTALRHKNGTGVCILYGSQPSEVSCGESGPIVTFNLKRPDGSWFGHREVEKLASLSGIHLRTGCFCNPGACAKFLGLSHLDLLANIEAGHVCWDDNDIICGKPTGAVRVSFGYMSTFEDAKKFVDFIRGSFVSMLNDDNDQCVLGARSIPVTRGGYYLKSITIYPIKSCSGFSVESWPLSETGLRHDRAWLLQSLSGEVLTQKKVPEMSLITTSIDLKSEKLFVESPRCHTKLQISLKSYQYYSEREEIDFNTERYEVQGYENEVNTWFSKAIGKSCTLLRCFGSKNSFCMNKTGRAGNCRDIGSTLNFTNEAQFLVISEESVSDLNDRLSSNVKNGRQATPAKVNPMRFRPNLVLSGGEPYAEDGWASLKIGSHYFKSLGGCNRCQMINFNLQAGLVQKSNEPLVTLASYRRFKGKILFGILLRHEVGDKGLLDSDAWLQVGANVQPNIE